MPFKELYLAEDTVTHLPASGSVLQCLMRCGLRCTAWS